MHVHLAIIANVRANRRRPATAPLAWPLVCVRLNEGRNAPQPCRTSRHATCASAQRLSTIGRLRRGIGSAIKKPRAPPAAANLQQPCAFGRHHRSAAQQLGSSRTPCAGTTPRWGAGAGGRMPAACPRESHACSLESMCPPKAGKRWGELGGSAAAFLATTWTLLPAEIVRLFLRGFCRVFRPRRGQIPQPRVQPWV